MARGHGLDLSKLYAQAAELHHPVHASHELYVAILVPACEVAGAVSLLAVNLHEFLGCHLGPVEITHPHAHSEYHQFAGNPAWDATSVLVEDTGLVTGYGLAYHGPVRLPFRNMARGEHGAFRRPVSIGKRKGQLARRRQFLSSACKPVERGEFVKRHHLPGYLRCEERCRYAVLLVEIVHGVEVMAQFLAENIERGPGHQRRIKIHHVGIEAEIGVSRYAVVLAKGGKGHIVMAEVQKVASCERHAFGFSRGPGGVEHHERGVGPCLPFAFTHRFPFGERRRVKDTAFEIREHIVGKAVYGHDCLHTRVLDHE